MAFAINAYSETPFTSEPSDVIAYPLGTNVTSQIGNFTTQANADVSVTDNSVTSSTGQAVAFSLVIVPVSGINANIVTGNEDAFTDITVEVTSAGQLTVVNQIFEQDTLTAFGEAPFATQSPSTFTPVNVTVTGTADIALTGIPLNIVTGNEIPTGNANVSVTGINLNSSVGEVYAASLVTVEVTGIPLTSSIGDETVIIDVTFSVTGQQLNSLIGNETAFTDVDVTVTGNSLDSTIADVSVTGTANLSLTGIPLTTAVGTVDHNSTYTVSGEQLTTAIGQAEADDASAEITGISLTTATGTVKFIIWSEVDTGTDVNWTEVDIAA